MKGLNADIASVERRKDYLDYRLQNNMSRSDQALHYDRGERKGMGMAVIGMKQLRHIPKAIRLLFLMAEMVRSLVAKLVSLDSSLKSSQEVIAAQTLAENAEQFADEVNEELEDLLEEEGRQDVLNK